jgi:hypothetical protein
MKRVETKAENNRAQQGAIPGTGSNGWERKGSGRGGGEEEEPPRPNHRLISWGSMTALCTRGGRTRVRLPLSLQPPPDLSHGVEAAPGVASAVVTYDRGVLRWLLAGVWRLWHQQR